MLKLIKNGTILTPKGLIKADILICNDKIIGINSSITTSNLKLPYEELDASNQFVLPGIIDQHVHLIGGGGESGFSSRTPEVQVSKLVKAGITSVLGLLGTDSATRHVESLYAKVKALDEEGISAYMVTGSYRVPSPTITDSVYKDVVFIDKVLGCKIAIADHRASHLSVEELIRIASEVRVASMLANKPGIIVVHMGNSKETLKLIDQALENSDIPIKHFLPTHVNRNDNLLNDAIKFALKGGSIDLTSGVDPNLGAKGAVNPSKAIIQALEAGVNLDQLTLSSDGNGSIPEFDDNGNMSGMGIAGFDSLLGTIRELIAAGLPLEKSWNTVSSNVASRLKLDDRGCLEINQMADLVFLNEADLALTLTMAKGKVLFKQNEYCVKGTFE
ncbi:beta-aspartyl-peptidase [Photobacterium profundum]|uniref:beta-aspartyl-peptidase n=1 Tax=Photobacterium profundum TaxID=74109 RepID=UPI003D0A2A8B